MALVLSFLEHEAKLDRVYSGLYALHREADHPRPVLGFFSAHGSDQGLHEAPTQQEPARPLLLELQTCRQLEGALLVLLSCLQTGSFPAQVVTLPPAPERPGISPVRAVIGYEPLLQVPPRKFILDQSHPEELERIQSILIAHARLLLDGKSVAETVREIQDRWREGLRVPGQPMELQLVYLHNLKAVRSWPENCADRL